MTAMRASSRIVWLLVAVVLLGTGWGANQFTLMLLVYRGSLGLGTGTLEAMFGLYALGLIPWVAACRAIVRRTGPTGCDLPRGGALARG